MEIHTPVLVYQMAKSAGTTLTQSLRVRGISAFNVQTLRQDAIERYFSTVQRPESARRHWKERQAVRKYLDETWGQVRWKVVCCFREPVSREISGFFENLRDHLGGDADDEVKAKEIALRSLQERLGAFDEQTNQATAWFDRELKETFGFDVYQHDFPRERGWAIHQTRNADILLIKYEMLNDVYGEAFREFMGLADFKLSNSNVGSQKPYANAYRAVRESIALSDELLDRIYACRYVRHCYDASEVQAFRDRWSGTWQRQRHLLQLGRRALETREESLAEKRFMAAIEVDPERACVWSAVGRHYQETGDEESAARYFSEALVRDAFDRDAVLLGSQILRKVRPEQAGRLCLEYIQRNPEDLEVLELLKSIDVQLGIAGAKG